jgi:hypothetical protein
MLDSHARLKRASVNDGARSPTNNNTHTHAQFAHVAPTSFFCLLSINFLARMCHLLITPLAPSVRACGCG